MVRANFQQCGYFTYRCLLQPPRLWTATTALVVIAMLLLLLSGVELNPGACCKSKTGRHNQDRSRRATNHRRILTRPVLIVATGLGFAARPRTHGQRPLDDALSVARCPQRALGSTHGRDPSHVRLPSAHRT